MDDATKNTIVEFIKKKTDRGKGLNTYRDITKGCPDIDRKVIKKAVQQLISEGVLDYWSSGSTTYIRMASYEPGEEGLTGEQEEE
jgi:hypothetical protein